MNKGETENYENEFEDVQSFFNSQIEAEKVSLQTVKDQQNEENYVEVKEQIEQVFKLDEMQSELMNLPFSGHNSKQKHKEVKKEFQDNNKEALHEGILKRFSKIAKYNPGFIKTIHRIQLDIENLWPNWIQDDKVRSVRKWTEMSHNEHQQGEDDGNKESTGRYIIINYDKKTVKINIAYEKIYKINLIAFDGEFVIRVYDQSRKEEISCIQWNNEGNLIFEKKN